MPIRVGPEPSGAEVPARRAQEAAHYSLRELAANLLRISRGAGRPHEVEVFAGRFLDACEEYRRLTGHGLPVDAIRDTLHVRNYLSPDWEWTAEQQIRNSGQERMVSGALQVAASRLLEQRAQEARGLDELRDGQRIIEDLHKEERGQRQKPSPSISWRRGS